MALDDQYMGLTQVARSARLTKDGSHLDNAAQMQLDYACASTTTVLGL